MNNLIAFFRDYRAARFFIPVGLILCIFSIFMFIFYANTQSYSKTEGTVTKTVLYEEAYTDADNSYHEETYTVFVKYTVDGKEYEGEYGILPNYHVGDTVSVAYDPKDPNKMIQPMDIVFPMIFASIGVASLVGGIISFIRTYNKRKALKEREKEWQ